MKKNDHGRVMRSHLPPKANQFMIRVLALPKWLINNRHQACSTHQRNEVMSKSDTKEVSTKKTVTWKDESISFGYEDNKGVETSHNDVK